MKNHKSEIGNHKLRSGFSLMEVLLAVGTLAIGMLFIACVFPVSIHFTTVASERTIAAAAADEAFAKIKLIGVLPFIDPNWNVPGQYQHPFESVATTQPPIAYFAYPSTPAANPYEKQYWWSAICRRVGSNDVQVTVFVCRKVGTGTTYLPPFPGPDSLRPLAVSVGVSGVAGNYELMITGIRTRINDGYTIVDDRTGQIYRVLERYKSPNDSIIRLDKPWQGGILPGPVWVVPPPRGGGRYPCIAVYQKVVQF